MNEPTTTLTCPKCKRPHGLFYYVYKEGPRLRRQLSYRCDHAERISTRATHDGVPIPVRTTAILIAPNDVRVPAFGLPEEYTAAAKEMAQKKAQLQLLIPTTRK